MNYLVTGGAGFIGSHLAELIRDKGYKVSIYSRHTPDPKWFDPIGIDVLEGDVMNKEQLKEAAKDKDAIFDCAGVLGSAETYAFIDKTIETNILGTLNGLEVARELGIPFIFLSLKNEWRNPYMISKRAGTELCEMFSQYMDTKAISIRGLNAYGPRQHWHPVRKMFPNFIYRLLTGQPIQIFGDGKQIVDMIYVTDMAEIMWRAYEYKQWGKVIDAGSGIPRTVKEVAELLVSKIGGRIEYIPMRQGEPHHAIALANPADVKQNLDFYPEVLWEDGVEKSIAWYKELLKK